MYFLLQYFLLTDGEVKNKKLTQAVVEMIIMDNLPFSFVEGKGFKNLIKQHSPLYVVPTRNTMKAHIDRLYETEIQQFKDFLSDVSYLTLTTDVWTDTQMQSIIGVTVHSLKDNLVFSSIIGVFKLTKAHTADYLAQILSEVISEFKINEEKIVAFVTDNAANIVKPISDRFGKHKDISCFAHTLNLVCDKSLVSQKSSFC